MRRSSIVSLVLVAFTGIAVSGCNPSTKAKDASVASVGKPRIVDLSGSELTSTSIEFGANLLNTQVTRKVLIRNEGASAVTLTGVQPTEATPSAFSYVSDGGVLRPQEQIALVVAFSPTTAGELSGAFTITVANADVPSLTIELRGIGVAPQCELSTQTLEFGAVSIGSPSAKVLRIQNRSPMPFAVTLASIEAQPGDEGAFDFGAGFGAGEHIVPAAAADGTPGELAVPIEFRPNAERDYSAELRIVAPSFCPEIVALHGAGVRHVLRCGPTIDDDVRVLGVDFGFVFPGDKATRAITCRNLGNSDINITFTGVRQPPDGAPFAIEGAERSFIIPAGGSPVSLSVSFSPTVVGEQHGTLNFATDNYEYAVGYFELVGTGGGPKLSAQPAQLDFGRVVAGTYQVRRVTFANVGLDLPGTTDDNLIFAVRIGNGWTPKPAEITGADAADFSVEWPPAGYSSVGLAEGQNCDLYVRFSPHSAGAKSATLVVYSNDPRQPTLQIALAGTGLDLPLCNYEIKPPAINFGSIEINRNLTLNFTIVNRDQDPTHECLVSMLDLTIATANANAFALPNGRISSATIPGGQSLLVPVRFQPRADGSYTGMVSFYISAATPDVTVSLSGVAQPACLAVSPRELDFGPVGLSCHSGARTITLTNTCSTTLSVTGIDLRAGSSSAFTLASKPSLPATVGAGASVSFAVNYGPTGVGADVGAVAITMAGNTNSYVVSLIGSGATDPTQTEIFSAQSKVDVLFIVDDSDPGDMQTNLGRNFASFIAPAVQGGVDYHIAVTTTSVDSSSVACGRFMPLTGSNPRVITPSTPYQAQVFSQNVLVGYYGSGTESLIRPAYLALSNPLLSGHNAGFYRDEAQLAVVVVSQAADQDPLATPIAAYERFFVGLKGARRRNDFSFSGIVPLMPTNPPYSSGCAYDSSDAGQDPRVKTIVQDTGGIALEVCNPDWSQTCSQLGSRVFGQRTTYFLVSTPDLTVATPFVVSVDGQPFAQYGSRGEKRWDYIATTNAIEFNALSAPDATSTVSVAYKVACQ